MNWTKRATSGCIPGGTLWSPSVEETLSSPAPPRESGSARFSTHALTHRGRCASSPNSVSSRRKRSPRDMDFAKIRATFWNRGFQNPPSELGTVQQFRGSQEPKRRRRICTSFPWDSLCDGSFQPPVRQKFAFKYSRRSRRPRVAGPSWTRQTSLTAAGGRAGGLSCSSAPGKGRLGSQRLQLHQRRWRNATAAPRSNSVALLVSKNPAFSRP